MPSIPDTPTIPKRRWLVPTPAKFLWAILFLQGVLFFSSHFHWFWFNERKGYTVLIAVTATAIGLVLFATGAVVSRLIGRKAQFGLSTLLLLILVMAMPLRWLGREIDLARRQRIAVASIRGRGDVASYITELYPGLVATFPNPYAAVVPKIGPPSYVEQNLEPILGEDFFCDVRAVGMSRVYDETLANLQGLRCLRVLRISDATVTDDALRNLRGLRELRSLTIEFSPYEVSNGDAGLAHLQGLTQLDELHLENIEATDAGLAHLRGLKRLQGLTIGGRGITDRGLSQIAEFEELTSLKVDAPHVTDQGLTHLANLTELMTLSVHGEGITDAGLERIRGLSHLESLGLTYTNITDAGIETLKEFKQLTSLSLQETKITEEGAKGLKEALPQCKIFRTW